MNLKLVGLAVLLLLSAYSLAQPPKISVEMDEQLATRFAQLPLDGIQKEYPNKLNQVLGDSSHLQSPKDLHPAFYGCFDWHSSVHGHWMLVKLVKHFDELPQRKEIRKKLKENLTAVNIEAEIAYFNLESNKSFERTYGWAWLLKLSEELHTWKDKDAQKWSKNLKPLADLIAKRYTDFLPKLTYPIRTGEHPNTAFGLSFALDYAVAANNTELAELIKQRSKDYFLADKNCPAGWEPSGFDFLSPCLEEAELMSKVLPQDSFVVWLDEFLPGLRTGELKLLNEPAEVSDRTDGKLVHLDGLNLSRAWCLFNIAKALPKKYQEALSYSAEKHLKHSISHITSGNYAGEHWLASFAVHAMFCGEELKK
jgi:hypothetical protein